MPPVFILFLVVHLLIDLAMPSLPGAFRFNPDESVMGVRVQPVQAPDLKLVAQMDLPPESFALPVRAMKTHTDSKRKTHAPVLTAFLPRRDPTPDRSLKGSVEDH
jgi:hypothetical protein